MSEILSGRPADVEAAKGQLRAIHARFPKAVVVGSFGRAALYSHFGWEEAGLFPVLDRFQYPRDIDLMFGRWTMDNAEDCNEPHPLEYEMGDIYAKREGRDNIRLMGDDQNGHFHLVVPRSVLATRVSKLDGVPVTTFTIGVQQFVEDFVGQRPWQSPEERAKYDASRAEFDRFAEAMRPQHPEEFPTGEALDILAGYVERIRGR